MKLFDKSLGTFIERSFEIVGRYMFVQVKNQMLFLLFFNFERSCGVCTVCALTF